MGRSEANKERSKAYNKKHYVGNLEYHAKRRKKHRDRIASDPEYRERVEKGVRERRERNLAVIGEFKRNGCLLCNERDHLCLHAHHKDPSKKEAAIGHLANGSLKKLEKELEKCVCLCANCHAKLHAGKIKLEGEENEKFINRLEYMFALV
jgi:hypothetical protein